MLPKSLSAKLGWLCCRCFDNTQAWVYWSFGLIENVYSHLKIVIFRICCFVPSDWTKAIIIPVYKKSCIGCVTNYRPISLTCTACKLMERIIAKRIYVHLAENYLLSQAQHGFVSGHSTCTNLLECLNDWTLTVQNKKTVSVVYIDFSRAFDSVSQ